MFSTEQRVFIIETFLEERSWRRCRKKFRSKYPNSTAPSKSTITKLMAKFHSTGTVLNRKKTQKKYVLTEERMDNIANRLDTDKPLPVSLLATQEGVSRTTAWRATNMLVKSYTTTVVPELQPADEEARLNFCSWFVQSVYDGLVDPELVFYTDEAWFRLSGYVKSQHSRYWNTDNPHILPEPPLYEEKIGVWCAVSARRIIGPIFHVDRMNSERYVRDILNPFFNQLTDEEKTYGYFMQESSKPHIANLSMNAISKVFDDRVISLGLWPPVSPDLNPCDFYLWEKLKYSVYQNNPTSIEELKKNIQSEISNITREELCLAIGNMFGRTEACVLAEGRDFQHYL